MHMKRRTLLIPTLTVITLLLIGILIIWLVNEQPIKHRTTVEPSNNTTDQPSPNIVTIESDVIVADVSKFDLEKESHYNLSYSGNTWKIFFTNDYSKTSILNITGSTIRYSDTFGNTILAYKTPSDFFREKTIVSTDLTKISLLMRKRKPSVTEPTPDEGILVTQEFNNNYPWIASSIAFSKEGDIAYIAKKYGRISLFINYEPVGALPYASENHSAYELVFSKNNEDLFIILNGRKPRVSHLYKVRYRETNKKIDVIHSTYSIDEFVENGNNYAFTEHFSETSDQNLVVDGNLILTKRHIALLTMNGSGTVAYLSCKTKYFDKCDQIYVDETLFPVQGFVSRPLIITPSELPAYKIVLQKETATPAPESWNVYRLVIGKEVVSDSYDGIGKPVFFATGNMAFEVVESDDIYAPRHRFMMINGQKSEEYDWVWGPVLSDDGASVIYAARKGNSIYRITKKIDEDF